ncbi:hypothetical protein AB0K51_01850 [Kitasatospora sp. NPDC049285]|uniref:hypothetical protein n=1 Tax=Kitasatospora sp. NPDC049285 TaxID=3157096 RepID=UPI0034319123
MTRTTNHRTMPASTPLTATAPSDPLLQLQNETEPPSGPGVNRCLDHADELALGGIPVICSACKARRDWLLINQGRNVYIRCRCANEWLEPEITRADNDFAVEMLFPGDSSDSIARATSHREMIIIAARLGIGVPMVAGRFGNLTKQWKLVGRLRESISDEDISALETIAKDVAA